MSQSVIIRVPATSANLGPGFDTLGIAMSLYNTFVFTPADMDSVSGCKVEYCGKDNLTLRAFRMAAQQVGLNCSGIHIEHKCEVPDARGLGSSSTCIVAGVAAAMTLADRGNDKQRILELATQIEGHPDNIAPAIFGGLTASIASEDDVKSIQIPIRNTYRFIALIPPFTLSTAESRQVLPKEISRQDAITNLSHVALLTAAMVNGQDDMLRLALQDTLHQPYRGRLIPNYDAIMQRLNTCPDILGAYLSGAGPTIMAITSANTSPDLPTLLGSLTTGWQILPLNVDKNGFLINKRLNA